MECVKYGKIRKCCAEQTSGSGEGRVRDRGFLKASLRAICKKADVTTGALYFFFESKAALFEEMVEETVEIEADHGRLYGSGKTTASGRI